MKQDEIRFNTLSSIVGKEIALFCYCAVYDLPYYTDIHCDNWEEYQAAVEAFKGNEVVFEDGETNLRVVLEQGMEDMEQCAIVWGEGYEPHEYKRLNSIFNTYSERLRRSGGMDAQQEDTLRVCSRMRLEADKALSKGGKDNIDIAAKLNKMIQDNLSAENLRKKDEKPLEDLRIDSIVDALEKAGLVKAGKILPLPDLQKALLERLGTLGGKPSHKYPYTLDAADQMILAIINTMHANDGLPELTELADNMKFDANVACEFADEPTPEEIETYRELGLVRHRDTKKENAKERLI